MTLSEQIASNRLKTILVFLMFGVIFAILGAALYAYTYSPSLVGVFGIGMIAYGVISYFASGKMIARMTGAKPVSREDYPELYHLVDEVAVSAGMSKTPPLYVVNDPALNAFAAGRKPDVAYVAVTTGLLERMDKRQLRAVIGHEVAHIVSYDVRLMSIATVMVGVIALMSDILLRMTLFGGGGKKSGGGAIALVAMLVAVVLAPIAAMCIQMALSRRREYLADARAVEFTGDAEAMALALHVLMIDSKVIKKQDHATAHMYIESPTHQKEYKMGFKGMFDTHPPLQERIAALEQIGGFQMETLLPGQSS